MDLRDLNNNFASVTKFANLQAKALVVLVYSSLIIQDETNPFEVNTPDLSKIIFYPDHSQ